VLADVALIVLVALYCAAFYTLRGRADQPPPAGPHASSAQQRAAEDRAEAIRRRDRNAAREWSAAKTESWNRR